MGITVCINIKRGESTCFGLIYQPSGKLTSHTHSKTHSKSVDLWKTFLLLAPVKVMEYYEMTSCFLEDDTSYIENAWKCHEKYIAWRCSTSSIIQLCKSICQELDFFVNLINTEIARSNIFTDLIVCGETFPPRPLKTFGNFFFNPLKIFCLLASKVVAQLKVG